AAAGRPSERVLARWTGSSRRQARSARSGRASMGLGLLVRGGIRRAAARNGADQVRPPSGRLRRRAQDVARVRSRKLDDPRRGRGVRPRERGLRRWRRERRYDRQMARFLHTMVRITDPGRSRAFYEALGFTFAGDFDIVRDGAVEATNYFFSLGAQESVLELTYNHDGRAYELGTGYGHIAVGVDDLDGTLANLAGQGIEPERPPYSVREGG